MAARGLREGYPQRPGFDYVRDRLQRLRGPLTMSEDFHNKNVGLVAGIIGASVLVLGLGGLILHLS